MHRKIYPTRAAKQKAWRARQAERRLYAIKTWVHPPTERPRLIRDVPWLAALSREAATLRQRLNEAERLAEVGRRSEAKINGLLNRVAELEQRERRREQNKDRKRRRREGGIILPSDPAAIREHYQQSDSPSAFTQPAPTISPNSGQNYPTDWTRPRQNYPTIGPRIGQDRDKDGTKSTPTDGHDGHDGRADGHDGRDWVRYVGTRAPIAPPAAVSDSQRQPAPAPRTDSEKLLAKIKAAGYGSAIRGDKILYGGTELITPEEWTRRMPGILD